MKLTRTDTKFINLLKEKGFSRENIADAISTLKDDVNIEYMVDWLKRNPQAKQFEIKNEINNNFK